MTINALSGHLWARILKSYCRIWDQHHQICQIAKFREKAKMAKSGVRNALFGYFWAGIFKVFCHICNQYPQICVNGKFYKKTKGPKFWTRNALFACFLKTIVKLQIRSLKFVYLQNFVNKEICLKLGEKMLYFGIFGHKFQKTIVIFEISTLKFSKLKNFFKKQKCLNLGRNKTYFSIFLPRTRKCYGRIWNQHPQICQMIKFLKKNKNA